MKKHKKSRNYYRKQDGVHLSRSQRKQTRKKLLQVYGNLCCWCKTPMEIPIPGVTIKNYAEMVTIEHYYAKKMNQPNNIMLFMLAHEKCNR